MNLTVSREQFAETLKRFSPERYAKERVLALYSATIAIADDSLMSGAIELARRHQVPHRALYEIVLQSYLFLGFPRMLGAAEILADDFPAERNGSVTGPILSAEANDWYNNGTNLCRRIYGSKYDDLKERVSSLAPEIFRWMIIEGYGKVLSRPDLEPAVRELSIVAFLTMENRPRQLRSHVMGALNVGTPAELLKMVVEDIGPGAGDGYGAALAIISRAGVS